MYEELSPSFLRRLEEYTNELLLQYTEEPGPDDTPKKLISLEIDRIKLISGDRRYNDRRYMIEYEVLPKRLKGLFYRNLVIYLEKDLSSFLNSSVNLMEY